MKRNGIWYEDPLNWKILPEPYFRQEVELLGSWRDLDVDLANMCAHCVGRLVPGAWRTRPIERKDDLEAKAIQLDGVDDYVDCGTDPVFNIPTNITVACWIKVGQFDKTWQAIVTKGDNSWRLHRSGTSDNIAWGTSGLSPTDITGSVNVNDGQWHHVAGVYDGTQKRLYVDGDLDASSDSTGNIDTSDYSVYIGENAQALGRYWTGLIDEVRVYSRALSGAEVAWLAGRTSPFSIPADLYQDDVIDFKDFAVLGDSWLEQLLWP